MDFDFTEEQQEVAGLARRILEDKVTEDVLRAAEAGDARFDRGTWDALAAAGLLGIGLPVDAGGGGYGIVEQCVVLEQVGRTVAPVPVAASTVFGAGPIARFGTDEQRQRWVRPAADGTSILTAALAEPANRFPEQPTTDRDRADGSWRLDGVKTCVPAGTIADAFVVPATDADGASATFVVERDAPGLTIEPQVVTTRDTEARLTLDGVTVGGDARIGGPEVLTWLVPARHRRPVRAAARRAQQGARGDRRVHEATGAVRPPDRHVPGRRPAHGRLLHRRRGRPAHPVAGALAPRGGAPRRHRGGGGEVLGGRGRSSRRPRGRAPPRRHRHRQRLPAPSLLPGRQGHRVRPRHAPPTSC